MEPDIDAMLRRAVLDVFDEDVDVTFEAGSDAPHVSRARLAAGNGADRRSAGLRAARTGFFELTIFDLGASTTLYEYDDESYMEALLRELALVADAYLRGASRIEQKRGLLRTRSALVTTVNGQEWALGGRTSRVHHPDHTSTADGRDRTQD